MLSDKQIKKIEKLTRLKCERGVISDAFGNWSAYFSSDNNNFEIYNGEGQFIIADTHYLSVKWLKPLAKILK